MPLQTQKYNYVTLLGDIRFWILLLFIVRLYGITNPPIEANHNWRQATVTMVARNYYEENNNILYPRVDFAGEKSGITGMEFPILNYLCYLTAEIFGYQHWYGRLINLIVSSFGLFFFFRLIKKYFEEPVAFYATIILAVSLWFQFSRKIMPDTFAMSFIVACLYYATNYLDSVSLKHRWMHLVAYALLLTIGSLAKLPAAFLIVTLGILIVNKHILLSRKIILSLITVVCMIPVFWWYFIWVPHLVETYQFWHFFMGSSLGNGFTHIMEHLPKTFYRFYNSALRISGFLVFLGGVVLAIAKKKKLVLAILLLTFGAFLIIMFKAGFTFYHHNYYMIPFAPVMAFVAGYALSCLNKKLAIILLLIISVEGIAHQVRDLTIKPENMAMVALESQLDPYVPNNALILINSGKYPTPMYFAHRKGWIAYNKKIKDPKYINKLKTKGLKYIVILKKRFGSDLRLKYDLIFENEEFRLYAP